MKWLSATEQKSRTSFFISKTVNQDFYLLYWLKWQIAYDVCNIPRAGCDVVWFIYIVIHQWMYLGVLQMAMLFFIFSIYAYLYLSVETRNYLLWELTICNFRELVKIYTVYVYENKHREINQFDNKYCKNSLHNQSVSGGHIKSDAPCWGVFNICAH